MSLTPTMSTDASVSNLRGLKRFWYLTKKLGVYLYRYTKHPRYLYLYLSRSLSGGYKEAVRFIGNEDFLTKAKNKSTIRLGDGEFGMLIDGRGIHFQSADPELINSLREILCEYTDQSPYLLGLNPHLAIENRVLDRWNLKYSYMQQKLGYYLHGNQTASYFNASVFYLDHWSKLFLDKLSENRHVIVLANHRLVAQMNPDELFPKANTVSKIAVPEIDAFSSYAEIMAAVQAKLEENTVVFVSAGPAGKVLIYELAKSGVLAHDIGHGLQFALEGKSQEDLIKWSLAKPYFEAVTVSQ